MQKNIKKQKGSYIMAYKTPEQMLDYILNEHLLTDACMTIIDGRNEYGFHAVEVPKNNIKNKGKGNVEITLAEGNKEIHVPVKIPDPSKSYSLWLMSFVDGRYDIICVQYERGQESEASVKQKEYLSVIAMFLDRYKVGTKTKLMNILKYGYAQLKKEINENNAYELLRDYLNDSLVVQRAEHMPDKYGVRFNFHFK